MDTETFVRSFDNTELYITSSGSGPAIILSDGIGCDGFIWRYLKPALKNHFQVVHWHYRGHGLSKSPEDVHRVDVPSLRQDLLTIMQTLEIPQAILLGHSMGSQLILDFALHHPEKVRALVPICGGYGYPLETFHDHNQLARIFPLLRDVGLRFPKFTQTCWRQLLRSWLAYQFTTTFELNGKLIQKTDLEPYFQHLSAMDSALFIRMLNALSQHSVEDRLKDISHPTLIVAGERDRFTPAWLSHRMAMLIPDAELLLVPGGTHTVPIEIPELVQLRIEKFLEKLDQPLTSSPP